MCLGFMLEPYPFPAQMLGLLPRTPRRSREVKIELDIVRQPEVVYFLPIQKRALGAGGQQQDIGTLVRGLEPTGLGQMCYVYVVGAPEGDLLDLGQERRAVHRCQPKRYGIGSPL